MATKKVYRYTEEGFYKDWVMLDETDISPSGNWNIPAYCTEHAPLQPKEDYDVKFINDHWEYIKKPVPPTPPEPPLQELKELKKLEIDMFISAKIRGGFESECAGELAKYDSDRDTQSTMQGIAINCDTPLFYQKYPNGCPVRGYKPEAKAKSIFYLSSDGVLQFCADLSLHIGMCKQEGWVLQDKVIMAKSKEDLDAIILE
nr:MAG TPA: protein of unknown function (DUF4376) [Caudoviricetes sp.]